ncbi:MAG: cytochrome b5 domain-containing protein [Gudongella sp.]|nr:cytochrome b5 domain-containing protein [Gudongella sp.]
MKKNSILTIIVVLLALVLVTACSPTSPAEETPETPVEEPQEEELILTLEELSAFDGQNGNRAYIAVDGVIYDVTDAAPWKDGTHNGFTAGNDLTKEIKEVSPHGISKLANVVEVGTLAK